MKTVDARGLSCSEPVVLTRNALRDGATELEVLVSDFAPKENVTRFATNQGYSVDVAETDDGWRLTIRK